MNLQTKRQESRLPKGTSNLDGLFWENLCEDYLTAVFICSAPSQHNLKCLPKLASFTLWCEELPGFAIVHEPELRLVCRVHVNYKKEILAVDCIDSKM